MKRVFSGWGQQWLAVVLLALLILFTQFLACYHVGIWLGRFVAILLLIPLLSDDVVLGAWVCYAGSALLGLCLLPDRTVTLFYVLTGYFPLLRRGMAHCPSKWSCALLKLVWMVLVGGIYLGFLVQTQYAADWEDWFMSQGVIWQLPVGILLAILAAGVLDRIYEWIYEWYDEEVAVYHRRPSKNRPTSQNTAQRANLMQK